MKSDTTEDMARSSGGGGSGRYRPGKRCEEMSGYGYGYGQVVTPCNPTALSSMCKLEVFTEYTGSGPE